MFTSRVWPVGRRSNATSPTATLRDQLLLLVITVDAGADVPNTCSSLFPPRGVPRAGPDKRRETVRSRIEMMRGYAETTDCRRRFLLGYFGEHSRTRAATVTTATPERRPARSGRAAPTPGPTGLRPEERVRHPQFGDGMVMSTENDRVTVLFAEHGYKMLSLAAVRDNMLLEPAD
jgi:ATP-dependent DNA helicase RecQ